jgi:hypothetical protein
MDDPMEGDVPVMGAPPPGETPPPEAPPPARDAVWPVYGALLLSLAVGAALGSARVVTATERQPEGPVRSLLVAVGAGLHRSAAAVGLDRPYALIAAAVHPPEEGFRPVEAFGRPVAPRRSPTRRAGRPPAGATPNARPTRPGAAPAQTARPLATRPQGMRDLPPGERPPPPPRAPRPVTVAQPLRLHVAGDSFAQPLAYEIQTQAGQTGLVTADLDFKLGSGVCRSDFFDWTARTAEAAASQAYDVLVFNVGGNDAQSFWTGDGWIAPGKPEWHVAYGQRAGAIMDNFRGPGVRVYWVGIPVLRDEEKSGWVKRLNAAVAAQAARRPWVRFVDTWPMFLDGAGAYNAYLPDPTGEETLVRQQDGVHLTREGTRWVAGALVQALRRDWALVDPTPTATARPPTATRPATTAPTTPAP